MARGRSRRGFTLVEMLLAITIFSVVTAALVSSFVGGGRLMKVAFATAEMSLRARDLRERLLFHAAPPSQRIEKPGVRESETTLTLARAFSRAPTRPINS